MALSDIKTGPALFDRAHRLIVGSPGQEGVIVEDLRIVFSGNSSRTKTSNEASIRIYNLADSTAARLAVGQVAQLSAGYITQIMPIITGDVTRIETYLDGVDRVTELTVHDSMVALRDSKTSISFAPGTSAQAILQAVGANFGLPLRMNVTGADKQIVSGFAFNGRTRNAFTEICDYLGLEWSAQQGEIQVMNKGAPYAKQVVYLSPESGLIGSPRPKARDISDKKAGKAGIEYGQDGIRRYTKTDPTAKVKNRTMYEIQGYEVRALLTGEIYPGAYVNLRSRVTPDGKFFVVDECTYQGDSHGGDWSVEATLLYPKEIKQNGD